MSNKRYLEIDSTYRNRGQYPNPSSFEVLISQSGTKSAARAYDPVSNAAPIKTWVPDELVLSTTASPAPTVEPYATNTSTEFVISLEINKASKVPDYYTGYTITVGTANPVKISTWTYLSSDATLDYFIVTVIPALSSGPTGATAVVFSSAATMNDMTGGNIFVPDGFSADHYYVGGELYNETIAASSTGTQNNSRTIISYDGTNKLMGINLAGGLVNPASPTSDNWGTDDTYSIRQENPKYIGSLPAPTLLPTPPPLTLPYQGPNTSTSFAVPADIIVSVGDFIRFTSGALSNRSYRVVRYTGNGQAENLSANPPLSYIPPNVVTVSPLLSTIPPSSGGWEFEVLQFTRDNAVPFCYSGSLVSQQEMVCYEIELLNLVLPNITLRSGGRTAFYPYVYVELQNVSSASAGTKCVMYSNNPNSHRMLFRAAIDDIPNPDISPFIKIDGDGMVQTIKFKPNDNLKFGVYLPNGELLQTVESDYSSPIEPNPLVQISAIFSIKRL